MDRWRAAWALLALAACFASSAAAPTIGNHTALDLYDAPKEGCYYNFQHYREGDRIMTNEPCLNCTCHNRMLMCYLRVCPFTKAIGQDCTVEKRADQCCPIVTCPDVPVDLLTSTTSSPAEYGGTGVGKVDNYGCSINGRYFPEGAKVPPTPNKPCEHCYCIRNMTTCVMQECTLHVDGCTPIYHKDVCCPVRYHCDHPEDEVPLLDDMSTTERPTPGFILTTPAPTEPPVTESIRKECVENDQLYPDGALIKTEKPCVHCYCMKGDIVCVVQECGTPMENEGKNCTSLPPREGQCCPDTYICEGDELTTEFITETLYKELTTLQPPRRASVEGSGYRNEPDEIPYTEIPIFATEAEGSGEELLPVTPLDTGDLMKPEQAPTDETFEDRYATEVIPQDQITTQSPLSEEPDLSTAEPDEELNIVPSGTEKESTMPPALDITTSIYQPRTTQATPISEQKTESSGIEKEESTESSIPEKTLEEESASKEPALVTQYMESSEPSIEERTTVKYEEHEKVTAVDALSEQTTVLTILESSSETTILKDETEHSDDMKTTEAPVETKYTISSDILKEETSEHSVMHKTTLSDSTQSSILHKTTSGESETKEPSIVQRTTLNELDTTEPSVLHTTKLSEIDTIEPPVMHSTKLTELDTTEPSIIHGTTSSELHITEPSIMLTTKLSETDITEPSVMHSSKPSELDTTKAPVMHGTTVSELDTTEPSVMRKTTIGEPETVEPSTVHRTTLSESETTEKSESSEKETIPTNIIEGEDLEITKTSPASYEKTTESAILNEVSEVESTEPSILEKTTEKDILYSSESNIPSEVVEGESSEPSILEKYTPKEETQTEPTIVLSTVMEEESSEPSILEKTTVKDEVKSTEIPFAPVDEQIPETGSMPTITDDENVMTTESEYSRRKGEGKPFNEIPIEDKIETVTTATNKESSVTSAYETPSAETTIQTDYEVQSSTLQPVKDHETKETEQPQEPVTESFMELSTFAHITEKESATSPAVEAEVETSTTVDKLEAPETSSINPEDNEIGEDVSQISSPGRIPGEGDCLLNGITYKNDSVIPSTNKCHSSCRCVSSIVKCDPIICSPPPEYMDNCQLTYDTPDSCCPTYVCDHSKETIPPQPHSQMSGTESPMPSPAIECHGDQCEVSKEKQPPTMVLEPSEQPDISECGDHGCDVPVQTSTHLQDSEQTEECNDGKCEQPPILTNKDQPLIPTIESEIKPCQNPEECKEAEIPGIAQPSCEGESCITKEKPCEGEDCKILPVSEPTVVTQQICENQEDCKQTNIPDIPSKVGPQICENEEDCKQISTPNETSCEGESCTKEECTAGKCYLPPKTSQEPEPCTDEGGCKKIEQGILEQTPSLEDKITPECTDSECLQQKPISTTQGSLISDLLIPEKSDVDTESPESLTTLSEKPVTSAPKTEESEISDKTSVIPESPITEQELIGTTASDYLTKLEESTTKAPLFTSELPESTVTDENFTDAPTKESEITPKAPEPIIPDTKVQEESTTVTGEIITKTPEISQSSTEISLDKESDVEPQTESPKDTDLYELSTTKISEDEEKEVSTEIPLLVKDEESRRTELPKYDELDKVTEEPEVSEIEGHEKITEAPEVSEIEEQEKVTEAPEVPEVEKQDKVTEVPKVSEVDEQEKVTEAAEVSEVEEQDKVTEAPEVSEVEEQDKVTEAPEVLEVEEQEKATGAPEVSEVEKQDKVTEAPEVSEVEEQDKVTEAPEVSEVEEQDKITKLPEVSDIDEAKHPEPPIKGIEQETSTELQYTMQEGSSTNAPEISVQVSESLATSPETETKVTEPSAYESHVSETDNPEILNVSEESATKTQDVSTETYVEDELTTKTSVPSISESVTEHPEIHAMKPDGSTEPLLIHTTSPPETITTELLLLDKIPDRSGIESDIETSTLESDLITKSPAVSDILETDVKTESPESFITSSVKYEITENLPTEKGEPPETAVSDTHDSDLVTSEETKTELPVVPTSAALDTSTTVSETMIDLEKIQTESPLSQVTMSEPSDGNTQQVSIIEQDEVYTEGPESYSKKPEVSVPEEEKPAEKPDSVLTEISKTETDIEKETTSKPEIQSEIPEKPEPEIEKQTEIPVAISTQPEKILTESPFTIATEQESVPEKESATDLSEKVTEKESSTTEQQEIITEAPVTATYTSVHPLVTEQQESSSKKTFVQEDESPVTEHKKVTTESPVVPEAEYTSMPHEKLDGTKEEPAIPDVAEVMESEKPLVTEEYETDTEIPEQPIGSLEPETLIPERTTEQADLEIQSAEPSKIPEIVTDIPVVAVTETRSTDGLTESQEKVTEGPESHVSQDVEVPVSNMTEPQTYITTEPEIYVIGGKETTEIPMHEKETKTPTEFVTEGQEITTAATELQSPTTSQKDIVEQEVTATETSKLSETKTPELPVTVLEIETRAPEIEKIEPEETKTEEPSELVTNATAKIPALEEGQTELPGIQDTSMVSQTEQPELFTTERNEQIDKISTEISIPLTTKSEEKDTVKIEQQAPIESITGTTESLLESSSKTSIEETTEIIDEPAHTIEPKLEYSETTPYLIELEEHTHKIDEDISTISPSEQPTTTRLDERVTEHGHQIHESSTGKMPTEEKLTETSATAITHAEKDETPYSTKEPSGPELQQTTTAPSAPEKDSTGAPEMPLEETSESSKPVPLDKETYFTSTPAQAFEETQTTQSIQSEKPSIPEKDLVEQPEKEATPSTIKPLGSTEILETTAPEEEFIPVTIKTTTAKIEEPTTTQPPTLSDQFNKPEEKPISETLPSTTAPEVAKPGLNELLPTDEVPSPEDESQFPPSGGYGQEPDYVEEDQQFGPGTCRYGGKVYVSAQQIPRDDPCDFCFCFRSDIICLQQSCPPPIHGCNEEPIQGFCCPRYECPVSMATTLNVTTTTTTTTTTLPPHFLPHAYKGAAQRRGCLIKGHTYKVGEVVRASSGPCLHCTCGGDGQMKCDPKACTPEPMLRQMIAAAVSAKRRR